MCCREIFFEDARADRVRFSVPPGRRLLRAGCNGSSRQGYSQVTSLRISLAICFSLAVAGSTWGADWEQSVTAGPPGPFTEPRPLTATYEFGWGEFTAATADVRFTRSGDRFLLDASAQTTGAVRSLWTFDVNYKAIADAATLRPLHMQQTETVRGKRIATELVFNPTGVSRTRAETNGKAKTKTKRFEMPNLFDLHSALLYIRSQALPDKSVQRIVVYPSTSAYLVTVTVLGREKVTVKAGSYNAIKVDLQLNKIGKKNQLQPHRKFRAGTAWISDDADRVPLRIEAEIFVGNVFAELQSVRFEPAKP